VPATTNTTQDVTPAPPDRLPPVERRAAQRSTAVPTAHASARIAPVGAAGDSGSPAADALEAGPDLGVEVNVAGSSPVYVRYDLDQVARTWVARFYDPVSGDLIRSVPSTDFAHHVARLRELDDHVVDRQA